MHLRQGTMNDSTWIAKLLVEGAIDGHFGNSMKLQALVFLNAIIESGGVQMIKLRGNIQAPTFVPMELTVAEVDGVPASFLICSKESGAVEIHLAGTKKTFRKNGCFTRLVSDAISKNKNSRIYARCYKRSSVAIKRLKNLNFKPTKKGEPLELTFSK